MLPRQPLTEEELRAIWHETKSPVVRALLWEIRRLRDEVARLRQIEIAGLSYAAAVRARGGMVGDPQIQMRWNGLRELLAKNDLYRSTAEPEPDTEPPPPQPRLLSTIPEDLIVAAAKTLPDAAIDTERARDVFITLRDGRRVRLTFTRFHHRRGKSTHRFWLAESAELAGEG